MAMAANLPMPVLLGREHVDANNICAKPEVCHDRSVESPTLDPQFAEVIEDYYSFFSRKSEGNIMKYVYLAPGDDRFGAVTKHPAYYIPSDEARTLDAQRGQIVELIRQHCRPTDDTAGAATERRIIEWGPGPSDIVRQKTLPLLELLGQPSTLTDESRWEYEAVDVSEAYAQEAVQAVGETLSSTKATQADFMDHATALSTSEDPRSTCMLCWGVTFGNFQGAQRERLIAAMKAYDVACFTVDHNLDLPSLQAAYTSAEQHSLVMGALEYFQTVVCGDVATGVSGFDLAGFAPELVVEEVHRNAAGDADELRVVGYIRSCQAQTLVFPPLVRAQSADCRVVHVAAGERFQVAESHKYSVERVQDLINEVPTGQPKKVVASGLFGEGSRIGVVVLAAGPTVPSQTEGRLLTLAVALGLFIDYALLSMVVPIFPYMMKGLGLSQLALGFLFAAKPLVQMLVDPLLAHIVDREHVWPIVAGLVLEICTTVGFACSESYAALLGWRSLQGFASAMIMTTGLALVARVHAHNEEARGVAMSMTMLGLAGGVLLGPTIGGELYTFGGAKFAFLSLAAATLIVLGITLPIILLHLQWRRSRDHTMAESKTDLARGVHSSMGPIRAIMSDCYMLALYGAVFWVNCAVGMVDATLGLWMSDLRYSASVVGVSYLGITVPFLLLVPWMGWLGNKFGRPALILCGLLLLGSSCTTMTLSCGHIWGIVLSLVGMGVGVSCIDGCVAALLAQVVDERYDGCITGSAFALKGVFTSIGFVAGPLLGTALMEIVGFRGTTLIGGACIVLFAPLMKIFWHVPSRAAAKERCTGSSSIV